MMEERVMEEVLALIVERNGRCSHLLQPSTFCVSPTIRIVKKRDQMGQCLASIRNAQSRNIQHFRPESNFDLALQLLRVWPNSREL